MFEILELPTLAIHQLAMPLLTRHQAHHTAPYDVRGLVLPLAQRGDDGTWHDGRVGPRGRNGVDADGDARVELWG
jgi:hypothetical protein